MAEYMTLLGAEDVRNASTRMQQAAAEMTRAAEQIEHSLSTFGRRMDEWIERLETVAPRPGGRPAVTPSPWQIRTIDGDRYGAEADALRSLLREARDWIARELQATEVELPDAEDLVIRMGRALPEEAT